MVDRAGLGQKLDPGIVGPGVKIKKLNQAVIGVVMLHCSATKN